METTILSARKELPATKMVVRKILLMCGVFSSLLYVVTNVVTAILYEGYNAPGRPKKAVPAKMPEWIIKRMGEEYHRLGMDKSFENVGVLAPLLGGHPDQCPEAYALFSPVTHVHSHCPPTLLIHGEHDIMAPIKATRI